MKYEWPNLKQAEPRGERLIKLIEMYVKHCHSVIDMNCGFAPLYPYLAKTEYTGFDKSEECIDYLKKTYPGGNWLKEEKPKFSIAPDLLILLGVSRNEKEIAIFKYLVDLEPRVVVLESTVRTPEEYKQKLWEILKKKYELMARLVYDPGFETENRDRQVSVYLSLPD